MKISLTELAELVGGKILTGEAASEFTGFQSLAHADSSDISFFGNEKYATDLKTSSAGVVLIPPGEWATPDSASLIEVENPVLASDLVIQRFCIPKPEFTKGIHPSASVSETTSLNSEAVSIMPNAVLLGGVTVGDGSTISSGAVLGENVEIGEDCHIGPNVSIREGCKIGDRVIMHAGVVIGGDGYGFEFKDGRHQKIEQLGIVRIGDDVEIGANSTIDRARFGETVIGEGTKIDNLVQIGHNAVIGKHCLIVAQTGISGSTKIGDYVTLAAQCGIAGHLKIADRVICGGRSGVISNIDEPGGTWFGYPAKPIKESRRDNVRLKQLGRLQDRVKALEAMMKEKSGD